MGRLIGIDLARCLALLGMVTAHIVGFTPGTGPGGVDSWYQITSGRSAALFAVLAGVSIALITRRVGHPGQPGLASARVALVARAILLAVLGLALGVLDSGVAVILTYYGMLFLLAAPVLTWSARQLIVLTCAWALLAPAVSILARRHLPDFSFAVPAPDSLAAPVQLLTELAVTGYYPVLTWGTYLFAGMAIGRLDLRHAATGRWLALLGAWCAALALAVSAMVTRSEGGRAALVATYDRWFLAPSAPQTWQTLDHELRRGLYGTTPTESWTWLWVWSPHSGSVVDLVHTVGTSMLVIGVALVLVRAVGAHGAGVLRLVAGAGTMTLTLYTLHVVSLAVVRGGAASDTFSWLGELHWQVLGVLLIGAGFAGLRWRGPLELALSRASRALGDGATRH